MQQDEDDEASRVSWSAMATYLQQVVCNSHPLSLECISM